MNGREARDPSGAAEGARAHQIGLLEIPGVAGSGCRIRLPLALPSAREPLGVAMLPEDPLDGTEGGKGSNAPLLQLQSDRLSPHPRKARGAGAMRLELLAECQHPAHPSCRCSPRPPLGRPTPDPKPRPPLGSKPAQPLGGPKAAATHPREDRPKAHALPVQLNGSTPQFVLISLVYHLALPNRKVSGEARRQMPCCLLYRLISLRCCEGSQVCDVLTVTP